MVSKMPFQQSKCQLIKALNEKNSRNVKAIKKYVWIDVHIRIHIFVIDKSTNYDNKTKERRKINKNVITTNNKRKTGS